MMVSADVGKRVLRIATDQRRSRFMPVRHSLVSSALRRGAGGSENKERSLYVLQCSAESRQCDGMIEVYLMGTGKGCLALMAVMSMQEGRWVLQRAWIADETVAKG